MRVRSVPGWCERRREKRPCTGWDRGGAGEAGGRDLVAVVRLRARGMALALVMMMRGCVVMLGPAARRAAVRQEEDAPGGSLQGIMAAGGGEYLCSVRKWSRRGRGPLDKV